MTNYSEVKDISTEQYFNNNKFSIDIFNKKYKLHEDESYIDALYRVCTEIASVEKTKHLQEKWRDIWFDQIYHNWWKPSGSIMTGAGNTSKISLANCTTIDGGTLKTDEEWDNLESLASIEYQVMKSAGRRQGLGVPFDRIRPKGTRVNNSSKLSSGPVHWMKKIDNVANYIGQCLVGNTLITTKRGRVPIKDIIIGDYVWTHKGWKMVVSVFDNGIKKVYEVKLKNRDSLVGTDSHRLMISDFLDNGRFKWIQIKDLDLNNDFVVSTSEYDEKMKYKPVLKGLNDREEILVDDFELIDDYSLIPLKSIEYIMKKHTYNFEVEDAHSYIANNIMVKNSGRIPAILESLVCFEKNTLVKTNKGELTIKEIIDRFPEKDLLIWTENGYKNITGTNINTNEDLYEVENSDGKKIKVTANHEFYVYNTQTKKEYKKKLVDIDVSTEEVISFNFKKSI